MVVNIEPSAQLPYALYDEGPPLEDCDLITTSIPLSLARKSHKLLTEQARKLDQKLLAGLERVGFRLNFGDDGTGWQFKYLTRGGGYYFNVGCSDLIAERQIGLVQYSDIAEFVAEGAQMRSGETLPADLIVLATGYQGQDTLVRKLFGDEVAARVGPIWGFGEGQELRNMFMRTPQPGLWFIAGSFAQCRIYSKYLGLQIKAAEEGLLAARASPWSLRLDTAESAVSFGARSGEIGCRSRSCFQGRAARRSAWARRSPTNFAPARAVFDEVDAALGEKLTATIWDGPADKLTLTENAQPALMAVSLAAMRVLQAEAGIDLARDAKFVAGHSLGEYSALAAAGAFSIADTAKLLRIRGRAMQQAVPVGTGAMAALLGLELDAAREAAAEAAQGEVCDIANDNGGGQVVVSGSKAAVDRAIEIAKAKGARRAMLLQVSAPFHCALMKPAADAMAEALGRTAVKAPAVPVVANVVAGPISDPQEIVRRLVEQVTGTVRWRECVAYMAGEGVKTFYEVGAGKVLTGLLKRIADGATGTAIGTPEDVAAFKAARGALKEGDRCST